MCIWTKNEATPSFRQIFWSIWSTLPNNPRGGEKKGSFFDIILLNMYVFDQVDSSFWSEKKPHTNEQVLCSNAAIIFDLRKFWNWKDELARCRPLLKFLQ